MKLLRWAGSADVRFGASLIGLTLAEVVIVVGLVTTNVELFLAGILSLIFLYGLVTLIANEPLAKGSAKTGLAE